MLNIRKDLVKLSKLALVALVAVPALALTVPANAADHHTHTTKGSVSFNDTSTVDPVNPTDPETPGPGGPGVPVDPPVKDGLALVYVSPLSFGNQDLPTGASQHYSTDLGINSPSVQVADNRGVSTGWSVNVGASPFKDVNGSSSLPGATIEFVNGAVGKPSTNANTAAPTITGSFTLATDGTTSNIAEAGVDEGLGLWSINWLDGNPLTGTSTPVELNGATINENRNLSVSLNLPTATKGAHSSELTWTLYNTPTFS